MDYPAVWEGERHKERRGMTDSRGEGGVEETGVER